MLNLQSGQRVLDVGCGIGGGDFYMAAQHDVFVHGIDLSVNMVLLALERAAGMSNGGKVGAKGWGQAGLHVNVQKLPPLHFDMGITAA